MALLRYLLRQGKGLLVVAVLGAIVSGVSSAVLVALINRQLTAQALLTPITIAAFGGLIVLVLTTDLTAKWLLTRVSLRTAHALRLMLTQRILKTPLRQLEIIGNPTLVSTLTEDIRTITVALSYLPGICISLTVMLGCMVYLTWLSPTLFALVLVVAMPTLLLYHQLVRRAKQELRAMLTIRDRRDRHFEALTQGSKELQLSARRRQAFWHHLLEPTLLQMQEQGMTVRMLQAVAQSWAQSVYFIIILAILGLALGTGLDLTLLTTYAVTALYIKNSINQILPVLPQWTEATLAFQKLETLHLAAADEEAVLIQADNTFPIKRHFHLTLSAITHAYTTDLSLEPFTLGPLDLHFSAGEVVFITGANGSGKTTLLKILAGLYAPESGLITLDGTPITEKKRPHYREQCAVVFSDFYLFEQLLGLEEATINERALTYLTKLQLHHKVTVEGGRLSTLDLSAGQRKRLALLTAYLEDRPIYLFDEWAANQDPAFKELFYRELLPELADRGKLVIAITHDDRYFALADRVLRLEAGRVVEETVSPVY